MAGKLGAKAVTGVVASSLEIPITVTLAVLKLLV